MYPIPLYLDDFHYFGDSIAEVEKSRDFTRALLRKAGYRLNMAKEQPPGTLFTALGLQYDLVAKTVCAKPGYISGLPALHRHRLRANCSVSTKEVASVLGSFIFLNAAWPGSLSHLSAFIAWVRAAKGNWRLHYAYSRLPPHVERALKLFESLRSRPCPFNRCLPELGPRTSTRTPPQRPWGLCSPLSPPVTACPSKRLFRLEADAVSWTLEQSTMPRNSVLRIDNEALVHALHKGRRNIKEANAACAALFTSRLAGYKISTKWISTDVNPADAPSRLHLARSELFVPPSVCEASYAVAC